MLAQRHARIVMTWTIFHRWHRRNPRPAKRPNLGLVTAKVPEELFDAQIRIADMKIGDIGHVSVWDLIIMEDRSCYLDPQGVIERHSSGMNPPIVTRDDQGYHVTVGPDTRLVKRSYIPPNLLPVTSVKVSLL